MIRHWFQNFSLFGIFALIFALSLNVPRPPCSVSSSEFSTVTSANQDSSSDREENSSQSQNNANSYEEIHDEIVIEPHQISKPYFSYFIPIPDTFPHGISAEEYQRPPRA